YNASQGKRQFMLPFASGIPNLNPQLSQVQGAGTAAAANIGNADGNVIGVTGVVVNCQGVQRLDLGTSTSSATTAIEMGSTSVSGNTFIDFHTSGAPTDYDVRLLATGGDPAKAGGGVLNVTASTTIFNSLLRSLPTFNQVTAGNEAPNLFISPGGDIYRTGKTYNNFGLGLNTLQATNSIDLNTANLPSGIYSGQTWTNSGTTSQWQTLLQLNLGSDGPNYQTQISFDGNGGDTKLISPSIRRKSGGAWSSWYKFWTQSNTTVDANGFIKSSSPIVKLFADSIELNDQARKQPVEFEKIDVGNYLLKGSLGFAQEGWYIELPKDANGNTVVAVEYSTLENGDISIKTYKRKFDFELAAVVADHENPMDIPLTRWIDIRLHEEPEPDSEIIPTKTPIDFQPTNLSE
ncbi:pyocin knob domain-containing protein, partial [Acinetobacter baumannii]|nr:pyocin knob domain-containing protein [Acinetobacter baumannii]